jgi:hypothetical protein
MPPPATNLFSFVLFPYRPPELSRLNVFSSIDSGHSDQQPSDDSSDIEEDGQDEGTSFSSPVILLFSMLVPVIITSDEQRIIDNVIKAFAVTHKSRRFLMLYL